MLTSSLRYIACGLLLPPLVAISAHAQVSSGPVRIEPGLEVAVGWTWWVAASDEKDWGFVLPEAEKSDPTVAPEKALAIIDRPGSYEVKQGDALSIIARKYGMTVAQLRTANGLTQDLIKIGQTLKIPTVDELKAMAPPPEPEPTTSADDAESTEEPAEKKSEYDRFSRQTRTVLLQSFLDRENLSSGPIDGYPGAMLEKVEQLYRSAHSDIQSSESLLEKAIDAIGEPYTSYTLKPDDFRFIAPPKAAIVRDKMEAEPRLVSYVALTTQAFLAYQTPWEFVAERFHCAERLLRKVNSELEGIPKAGTKFKVPNVIPFEIEKAFEEPLQPAAAPANTITAAIVDLKRLEIFREGKLVAAFPMSVARPGLRGRGSWTILEVISRPRLVTKEEKQPRAVSPASSSPVPPAPDHIPRARPVVKAEQDIAAGPNNPVGILWIELAKSNSTDPLPYGLHGTSIPGRMDTQESIGGLRLANWDIVRAVRLLPPGTPLKWQ